MNWFYIDESILEGDRRQGPVSFADLQALQEQNKICETTLVWHKGLENWISWKDALEKSALAEAKNDRLLQETINAILQERVEESRKKTPAGFWIRGLALLIDWVIITVCWELTTHILDWLSLFDLNATMQAANAFIETYSADPTVVGVSEEFMNLPGMSELCILWFIIQTIYFIGFTAAFSATPGKMLLRLKIERANGEPLKLSGAIIRYALSLLTQATLIFYGIGYILAIIDPRKRTLHDFFAKTFVVRVHKDTAENNQNSKG